MHTDGQRKGPSEEKEVSKCERGRPPESQSDQREIDSKAKMERRTHADRQMETEIDG